MNKAIYYSNFSSFPMYFFSLFIAFVCKTDSEHNFDVYQNLIGNLFQHQATLRN